MPEMQEYFDSPEWKEIIYWDDVLHKAVNRSLDLTIERLGREDFLQNLERFRKAKELVTSQCLPSMRLPCTDDGVVRNPANTDCLYDDMGCGFDCMDKVLSSAASISR